MVILKVIIVGDGNVGKTSLLTMYATQHYPNNYVPTVLDNYAINLTYNDEPCRMEIWDTAGQEAYDCLRKMSYPHTDVFLLCFAINEPSSFSNAAKEWYPEFHKFSPNADVILVGTKVDLRNETNENGKLTITHKEGLQMAKRIKAYKYMECSALERIGLKEIFQCAMTAYFERKMRPPKRRKCSIL